MERIEMDWFIMERKEKERNGTEWEKAEGEDMSDRRKSILEKIFCWTVSHSVSQSVSK